MTRIHLLLTPDNDYNKEFKDVLIIGFRRTKCLKDIPVRAKISQMKSKGRCGPCKGSRCENRKHVAPARNFSSSSTKRIFEIRPEKLNFRSKKVVYLVDILQNLTQTIKWNL